MRTTSSGERAEPTRETGVRGEGPSPARPPQRSTDHGGGDDGGDPPGAGARQPSGALEPGDDAEERRFAATGRAGESDELPGVHDDVDAAQRAHGRGGGVERPAHVVRLQHGHGRAVSGVGHGDHRMPETTGREHGAGITRR